MEAVGVDQHEVAFFALPTGVFKHDCGGYVFIVGIYLQAQLAAVMRSYPMV